MGMTEPTIYDRSGEARRALRDIIDGYGQAGADDARLVNSLLPDLLPGSPPEAKLLVAAATFRVASMLSERIPAMPPATAVRDVATLLAHREAMDARACQWVVGEYALAMGYELVPTSPPQAPQPQPMQRYGMPVAPSQSPPYAPPQSPQYPQPQSPQYPPQYPQPQSPQYPPQYSQPQSPQSPQYPPQSPPYSPPMSPQVNPGMPTSPSPAPGIPSYPATQADASPRYTPPPSPHYTPPVAPQRLAYIPGYVPPVAGVAPTDSRARFTSAAFFLGGALFTLISSSGTGAPYPAYAFATGVVFVIVAILLFNQRSAAVGEGAAIGAGAVAFANTLVVFDLSDSSGFQQPMAIIAILLVLAGAIVAMVSRRPLPRGPQAPGWIAIGLIAVLIWIITDNVGWVSGDGGSCCTLSDYSGWNFFSDLMEMLLSCALLVWAVATGPTPGLSASTWAWPVRPWSASGSSCWPTSPPRRAKRAGRSRAGSSR